MLINFRFKNCRSFYDEANLSMQATIDKTRSELNTFSVNEGSLRKNDSELLKSVVVFGGNASGKSNIIKAFAYMVNVVRLSSAQLPIVPANEYYAFNTEAYKTPSLYEVEIIQNGIYYKYGFELLQGKVSREWLYKREERLIKVFDRNGSKLEIMSVSSQAINLIKIPEATLFLSSGNIFNLPINRFLSDVMVWFANVLIVFENTANSLDIYTMENGKYKEKALEILKRADIGIADFSVIKDKVANVTNPQDVLNLNTQLQINPASLLSGQIKAENENLYHIDVRTDFSIYDNDNNVVGTKNVMLFKENGFNSEGTVRLLCYMGWILAALDQGRTIFIDEIDSKLHFLVADYIIGMFNSIEDNPKNSQLICTAHNVLLMDDGMRRDQIYFTSKDRQGKSTLVSLADFNGVRKNDLFSKRYLAGFYASLPDLSTIE